MMLALCFIIRHTCTVAFETPTLFDKFDMLIIESLSENPFCSWKLWTSVLTSRQNWSEAVMPELSASCYKGSFQNIDYGAIQSVIYAHHSSLFQCCWRSTCTLEISVSLFWEGCTNEFWSIIVQTFWLSVLVAWTWHHCNNEWGVRTSYPF